MPDTGNGSCRNSWSSLLFRSCPAWEYHSGRHSCIPSCVCAFSIVFLWSKPFHRHMRLAWLPLLLEVMEKCVLRIVYWLGTGPLLVCSWQLQGPAAQLRLSSSLRIRAELFLACCVAKNQIEGRGWFDWANILRVVLAGNIRKPSNHPPFQDKTNHPPHHCKPLLSICVTVS